MTDEIQSLVLPILRDIQVTLNRMDGRLGNLEQRMSAQEDYLGALVTGLPASQDRIDNLGWRMERVEDRLELADPS